VLGVVFLHNFKDIFKTATSTRSVVRKSKKTKYFFFATRSRGKLLQGGALARGARLPSGFAAR